MIIAMEHGDQSSALRSGAAILEGGLGFAQFFWDTNQMRAQDRLDSWRLSGG
ncbi:MAG: hypothetical protein WA477_12745 [Candidatus Sulfotelmatobacter sp.]